MVGAIADWFAVTALFKHPLGLPIPHTALIPRRKDDLGVGWRSSSGRTSCRNTSSATGSRPRPSRSGSRAGSRWRRTGAGSSTSSPTWRPSGWPRSPTSTSPTWFSDALVPALPGGADRAAAGRAARRDRPRRPAPRAGRPGPRGAAPLAGRQPGHVHRGAGRTRSLVGADPAQRRGDLTRCTRGDPLGGRHPRRPRTTMPGRRSTRCWRSSPQDLLHDPVTQARAERTQGAAAAATRPCSTPRCRCGTPCAARCSARCSDPRGRGATAAADRAGGTRRPAARGRASCVPAST